MVGTHGMTADDHYVEGYSAHVYFNGLGLFSASQFQVI